MKENGKKIIVLGLIILLIATVLVKTMSVWTYDTTFTPETRQNWQEETSESSANIKLGSWLRRRYICICKKWLYKL